MSFSEQDIRKERSLYRHADKVVDVVVVILIFNIVVIEKTILSFAFAIAREEKIPQYQKIWHRETTKSTRKLFENNEFSLPSSARGQGRGTSDGGRWGDGGGSWSRF